MDQQPNLNDLTASMTISAPVVEEVQLLLSSLSSSSSASSFAPGEHQTATVAKTTTATITQPKKPTFSVTSSATYPHSLDELINDDNDDAEIDMDADHFAALTKAANFGAGRQLGYTSGWGSGADDSASSSSSLVLGGTVQSSLFFGGGANRWQQQQQQQPTTTTVTIARDSNDDDDDEYGEEDIELPDDDPEIILRRTLYEFEATGISWKRKIPITDAKNQMEIVHGKLWNICKGNTADHPCYILGELDPEQFVSTGELVFKDKYYTFIEERMWDLLEMPKNEFDAELEEFADETKELKTEIDKQRAAWERDQADINRLANEAVKNEEIDADAAAAAAAAAVPPNNKKVHFASDVV